MGQFALFTGLGSIKEPSIMAIKEFDKRSGGSVAKMV